MTLLVPFSFFTTSLHRKKPLAKSNMSHSRQSQGTVQFGKEDLDTPPSKRSVVRVFACLFFCILFWFCLFIICLSETHSEFVVTVIPLQKSFGSTNTNTNANTNTTHSSCFFVFFNFIFIIKGWFFPQFVFVFVLSCLIEFGA